ncbi:MAG: Holliday junction branch migration protein RuvA [Clostridiales bacterium]
MFAYISGILDHKNKDYVVVDVSGVGYKIYTSMNSLCNLDSDEKVKMYTYIHIREDILDIYGFSTKEELGIFELLISVSGVGPKAAISVLSTTNPSKFSLAVINNDIKILTAAQGIGKKIAQRIILELQDKISKEHLEYINTIQSENSDILINKKDFAKEAVSALMVLGYSPAESNKLVSKVFSDDKSVENLIKDALKLLA